MEHKKSMPQDNIIQRGKATLFDWVGRGLVGLLVYLAVEIRNDVKVLTVAVPVLEEKVKDLERKQERMENKVFTDSRFQYPYNDAAKKEDEKQLRELLEAN